jgi:hypothetical protein
VAKPGNRFNGFLNGKTPGSRKKAQKAQNEVGETLGPFELFCGLS